MDSSLFLAIMHATVLSKIVLGILLLMSVTSWTIIISKWLALDSAIKQTNKSYDKFRKTLNLEEALAAIGSDYSSPVYSVAREGIDEWKRVNEQGSSADIITNNVRRALHAGISAEMSKLSTSLSFLATAANTAPFIGLFGTVWGIMHSFSAIGLAKSASLATVAPGISEALVATAVGLFVAIPASIAYNNFLGKCELIESKLVNFASAYLNRVQSDIELFHNDRR